MLFEYRKKMRKESRIGLNHQEQPEKPSKMQIIDDINDYWRAADVITADEFHLII